MSHVAERATDRWRSATAERLPEIAIRAGLTSSDDSAGTTDGRSDDAGGCSDEKRTTIETDGGRPNGDTLSFSTYTDDGHGYRLAYPADWSVERDSDGATFEAPVPNTAGVVVFVEEGGLAPAASAEAFLTDLTADEHVHALCLLAQRDTPVESGQTGRLLECAYVGDSGERWRLSYLFILDGTTGYTLGVDWNDADRLEAVAARIVESFVLGKD